ncbi:MAG: hypothetical protein KDD58_06125 [Bdellovibrionales bacterium]|nr:hypothetical protein [Bdellovibrionales bacterium]
MTEEMTEQLNTTKAERIRFILLVVGFIALAMISQRNETNASKVEKNNVQVTAESPVVCANK